MLLASFVFRNYFDTKPLATWLPIVSIVSPWATFGYLLSYGRCSPSIAQLLATFCSSLDYLLFGSQRSSPMACLYKNCQHFQSLMFASFSCRCYLARLHSEISSSTKPLATGLLIVSHCLTMGYLWLPFVICQV